MPVYNPGVELLKEGRHGYIEQPVQQREFTASEIAAGETFWAGPFIVVPEQSGDVDLSRSFIKKVAGDVDLDGTIVVHDRVPPLDATPKVEAHARKNAVVLDFDQIPDASDYNVYATHEDRNSDFPLTPLAKRVIRPGKIMVSADPSAPLEYAISTHHGGREMIHPLVRASSSSTEIWPELDVELSTCGEAKQRVKLHIEDRDFNLARWRYQVDDGEWQEEALSGEAADRTIDVPFGEDRRRVRIQAQNTEQLPNGWTGDSYMESYATVGRCNLAALGDSVSAGEGIGYGFKWIDERKRWEDSNGADEQWDDADRPADCHQTSAAHPRELAVLTGMKLVRHLSCTGATFDKGLAGNDKSGSCDLGAHGECDGPQLGGFGDGPVTNGYYFVAKPDVVTLSIGANDIEFAKVVGTCFYPLTWLKLDGSCDGRLDDADRLLSDDTIAEKFRKTYQRIADIGNAVGRRPLVMHTQYINPFPDADEDASCWDITGGKGSGFSRVEIDRMVAGLKVLNGLIESEARKYPGVVSVPVNSEFDQHRFCSKDPWVFGMDTALDAHGDLAVKHESPFHPTADGQAALARQVQRYMNSAMPTDAGENREAKIETGERIAFRRVNTSGATLILRTAPFLLPTHPLFKARQAYDIYTSVTYDGEIEIELPALPGDKMWHFRDGAWEVVNATYENGKLKGTVTSLSPFAVGPAVEEPVDAKITAGDGGVAPIDVAFSAAQSTGPVATVDWDFGDGGTATGMDVSHRYLYSGTYEVTATVTGVDGGIDRATTTVTITNPAPTIAATVPSHGAVGVPIQLDSRASTDSNGTVRDGWWEFDGKLIEPGGQLTELVLDTPGTVTVEAVVRDDELEEARKTFTIEIAPSTGDTTPPVISGVPEDSTVTAADAAGATVSYALPTAVDEVDGSVGVECAPASGTVFGVGATVVSCSASDRSGNRATRTFRVTVRPAPVTAPRELVGAVPATLALTITPVNAFGTFVPGLTHDYLAQVEGTVTTTAGEAVLTIGDADSDAPGRLVNGGRALREPVEVSTGAAFVPVPSLTTPAVLGSYAGPTSLAPFEFTFRQRIGGSEPLRTGHYGKALRLTLSTTTP